MIVTLLEKKWFYDPKMSALEAVYRSDFAQVVRLFSIENAAR